MGAQDGEAVLLGGLVESLLELAEEIVEIDKGERARALVARQGYFSNRRDIKKEIHLGDRREKKKKARKAKGKGEKRANGGKRLRTWQKLQRKKEALRRAGAQLEKVRKEKIKMS